MSIPSNIPPPNVKFLDENGNIATVWWQYLLTQFNRTGGISGTSPGGNPVDVPTTTSPLTFQAPADGAMFVSGGGVYDVQLQRGAADPVNTGHFYAPIPMSAGDIVTISFIDPPPTVTFLPR